MIRFSFILLFLVLISLNCLFEASDTTKSDNVIHVFQSIVGSTAYRWREDIANNTKAIEEVPLEELLKDKKVIGLYFSASWCGPCKTFTPQLASFYRAMNKKGKKFEIIWISRDRSTEDFVSYFATMPWLAMTLDDVQNRADSLSQLYRVKGIPHLVILDGIDAEVYTFDGRTMVMKDSYGLEFPWRPRSLLNILPRSFKVYLKQSISASLETFKVRLNHILQGVLHSLAPRKVFDAAYKTLSDISKSILSRYEAYKQSHSHEEVLVAS